MIFKVAEFCTLASFISMNKTPTLTPSFTIKEAKITVGTIEILNRVTKSTETLIFRKKYIVPHGVLTPQRWDFSEKR